MKEIQYNTGSYQELVHIIGRAFGVGTEKNIFHVPAHAGKGYMIAYDISNDLSVMITDTVFYDTIHFHRLLSSGANQQLILQFNESFDDPREEVEAIHTQHIFNINKNASLLTSSLMDTVFVIPADTRVNSINIIFSDNYLRHLFGEDIAHKFTSNYFSLLMKNQLTEHIDTDHRAMIQELVKKKIDHPLPYKFVQNRALLLIEKKVISFIEKIEKNNAGINLKDDEINRLMKVEALLVKDFSIPSATIPALSKIAAMSATKLKNDFKLMYGLPLNEYYQKNRMQKAKSLIRENDFAIKEVGKMVGYTNLGHFAAAFKKEFGVLPSEMQQEPYSENFTSANAK